VEENATNGQRNRGGQTIPNAIRKLHFTREEESGEDGQSEFETGDEVVTKVPED
jgi:hypothetical protein